MKVSNEPRRGDRSAGQGRPSARPRVFIALVIVALAAFAGAHVISAAAGLWEVAARPVPAPAATPAAGSVATAEQVAAAQAAWSKTRHANTYDSGMGANTTCASCKSPANWDPTQVAAAEASHDCQSCKREPGAPRPDLPGGVAVAQSDWKSITCSVCHQPVGDSFSTALSWWNQQKGAYEPVADSTELCGKCHEGSHGFDVVWEQTNSTAHKGWDCTRCHGSHGSPVKCTDCHDVTKGPNATVHSRHPQVNCTACHDGGGLAIWLDPLPDSRHFGEYVPQRFAHTLRSWPSHDIQLSVDCRRCHHPQGDVQGKLLAVGAVPKDPNVRAALSPSVPCSDPACHSNGAVFEWCPVFPRDVAPTPEVKRP